MHKIENRKLKTNKKNIKERCSYKFLVSSIWKIRGVLSKIDKLQSCLSNKSKEFFDLQEK